MLHFGRIYVENLYFMKYAKLYGQNVLLITENIITSAQNDMEKMFELLFGLGCQYWNVSVAV